MIVYVDEMIYAPPHIINMLKVLLEKKKRKQLKLNKMTPLEKKLNDECLKARKEKDSLKANLLLTIKGQVQNAQKGPNASNIDEIINSAAKSILKGLETVTQTDDTKREKQIAEEYLPQFMKEEEVIEYVSKMEFSSSNLGACIGQANKELAGKADGKTISLVVKNFISSKSI